MHTCRSVNAEVILIHESNSKNNLKHVVDMAGSLLDWSAEWEVAKTLRQGQKKLQKNVVYDSTARNLIGRNENIWDGSWVLKHMRWTKRQGWLSYKSQSTSPPVLVMNKEKQGWLSYVKINKYDCPGSKTVAESQLRVQRDIYLHQRTRSIDTAISLIPSVQSDLNFSLPSNCSCRYSFDNNNMDPGFVPSKLQVYTLRW